MCLIEHLLDGKFAKFGTFAQDLLPLGRWYATATFHTALLDRGIVLQFDGNVLDSESGHFSLLILHIFTEKFHQKLIQIMILAYAHMQSHQA